MLGERSCADYLRTHWPWPNASDDAPVVLTSATSVPRRWLLGLSAAREGLPLVVASLGEPGGWKWNEGTARKLPGARAAVEMLSSARPSAAVIMLDGSDTTVLNPWQSTAAPAALSKLGQEAVLVGGECNSWPICYEQAYDSNPPDGYRDCRARSLHTCYPNGGTFLARAAPMLAFLRALEAAVAATLESRRGRLRPGGAALALAEESESRRARATNITRRGGNRGGAARGFALARLPQLVRVPAEGAVDQIRQGLRVVLGRAARAARGLASARQAGWQRTGRARVSALAQRHEPRGRSGPTSEAGERRKWQRSAALCRAFERTARAPGAPPAVCQTARAARPPPRGPPVVGPSGAARARGEHEREHTCAVRGDAAWPGARPRQRGVSAIAPCSTMWYSTSQQTVRSEGVCCSRVWLVARLKKFGAHGGRREYMEYL